MNEAKGEFLVGLALALRGTSLLFSKLAMQTMGPFLLMGTRFLIAFIVIAALFHRNLFKVTGRELFHCALIGFFFFLSMAFELQGLKTTPSSVTAFLEGVIVIFVPLLTCLTRRKLPDKVTVITCLLALAGVAFLTLKGERLNMTSGELFILVGTLWYSCTVLITDTAAKNDDLFTVSIYQLLFISLFGFIGAFIFEDIRIPNNMTEWGAVLALAFICSVVGFTIQPFGQKYITPERAGLLAVFNPVSASILGILFLHEKLTLNIVTGMLLILISIAAPSVLTERAAAKSACAAEKQSTASHHDNN